MTKQVTPTFRIDRRENLRRKLDVLLDLEAAGVQMLDSNYGDDGFSSLLDHEYGQVACPSRPRSNIVCESESGIACPWSGPTLILSATRLKDILSSLDSERPPIQIGLSWKVGKRERVYTEARIEYLDLWHAGLSVVRRYYDNDNKPELGYPEEDRFTVLTTGKPRFVCPYTSCGALVTELYLNRYAFGFGCADCSAYNYLKPPMPVVEVAGRQAKGAA